MMQLIVAAVLTLMLGAATAADAPAGGANTLQGTVRIVSMNGTLKKRLSGVVVFLDAAPAAAPHAPPAEHPLVSQRKRRFTPRVLPVVRGTAVDFPNDDNVLHNVFSLSEAKPFDLGVFDVGATKTVELDRTGLVKVYCNIHPDMVLYVPVLDNPYFAATDTKGAYAISDIPDGTYRVRVWHELADEQSTEVTVAGGEVREQNFTVQENREFQQHKNKFGKDYRGKY